MTTREWASPDDELMGLLEAHGFARVETPILQPAEIFLDLSGEDIRRRLYLTQDSEGRELCLRPEHTIPVCRRHLASGAAAGEYCYLGPVFRLRGDQTGEFVQAGIESIGREERAAADAECLDLALNGLKVFGAREVEIVVGDMGLLAALVDSLGLPAASRRRLLRALGAGTGVAAALSPEPSGPQADYGGLLAAIEGQNPKAARAFVEDVMTIAGIAPVGGRSAGEIAERFLSRAENRSGSIPERARAILQRYLDLRGDLDQVASAIRDLARDERLDLKPALSRFEERTGFIAACGIDVGSIRFAGDFARNLDYYTGFVFELRAADRPGGKALVGGGRYDGLLRHLGHDAGAPAVGCSFWLDRLRSDAP